MDPTHDRAIGRADRRAIIKAARRCHETRDALLRVLGLHDGHAIRPALVMAEIAATRATLSRGTLDEAARLSVRRRLQNLRALYVALRLDILADRARWGRSRRAA